MIIRSAIMRCLMVLLIVTVCKLHAAVTVVQLKAASDEWLKADKHWHAATNKLIDNQQHLKDPGLFGYTVRTSKICSFLNSVGLMAFGFEAAYEIAVKNSENAGEIAALKKVRGMVLYELATKLVDYSDILAKMKPQFTDPLSVNQVAALINHNTNIHRLLLKDPDYQAHARLIMQGQGRPDPSHESEDLEPVLPKTDQK